MKSFLLVYDRAAGTLLECQEFDADQRDEALRQRFEREVRYRTDQNIEVVVLGAESKDVLERTHGRYFNTVADLFTH